MACRICYSESVKGRYRISEQLHGTGDEFDYVECADCGCVQINEVPANLADYYPTNYYSYKMKRWSNTLLKRALVARDRAAVLNTGMVGGALNFLRKPAAIPEAFVRAFRESGFDASSKVLDVGCGDGTFVTRLGDIGFTRLLGVDPYLRESSRYSDAVSIEQKSIHDVEGKWDIITMHHSFEHMSDPHQVMEHIARLLSDSGICLIRVPVVPCFAWDKYREDWVQADAPRHLFLHSPDSIRILANKVGLEVEKLWYDSTAFQIVASERYVNRRKNQNTDEGRGILNGVRRYIARVRAGRLARKLNEQRMGDQAAFVLRHSGASP